MTLEGLISEARSQWPEVRLGDAEFSHHLERLGGANANVSDLYLACACVHGDRAALAALDARLGEHLQSWIRKVPGVSVDDVRQELRQKLLVGPAPKLRDYAGRHTLDSFLRIAAVHCAIDLQRKEHPGTSDPLEDLWDGPDPELDLAKLRDAQALKAVLQDALAELPAHERSLVRLHYIEGVSLDRLAVIERVHRATVARWLSEVRARLLERVRALAAERLRLSGQECESLLRFVRSRLDLSLERALDT